MGLAPIPIPAWRRRRGPGSAACWQLRLLRSRGGAGAGADPPGCAEGVSQRAGAGGSTVAGSLSRTAVRRPIPARTLLSSRRLAGMVMDLARGGRRAPQHSTGMWKSSPRWLPGIGFLTRPDVIATTRTPALPPPARPPLPPLGRGLLASRNQGWRRRRSEARQARKGSRQAWSRPPRWPSSRGAFCGTLSRRV